MDATTGWMEFTGGRFEPLRGELTMGDRRTRLRPRTAAVFACLLAHGGTTVSRDQLMQQVWPDVVVTDESLAQCIKEIRRALGPAAERLCTIPRLGYAFSDTEVPTRQDPSPEPLVTSTAPARKVTMWRARALAALCSATAVGIGGAWWLLTAGPPPRAQLSMVVLPLYVSPGEQTPAYVAEALSERLTNEVSRIPGSFVIGYGTASRYGGKVADAREVGRALGVRYVVEGSLRRQPEQVDIATRLVDASDGHVIWSDRITGPLGEVEEMQSEIAARIARTLHLKLIDAEAQRARRHGWRHPDAFELTMQGWSLWQRQNRADNVRAQQLLKQAVTLDPSSALAWAGLSNTYVTELAIDPSLPRGERLQLATAAAERAFQEDPDHINALGALGTVRALHGRYEEALTLFERLLRINPNYAPAEMWIGIVQTQLGDPEAAIPHARRAIRVSPQDPRLFRFQQVLAVALLHAGRSPEALAVAQEAAAVPPAHPYALLHGAAAAMLSGDEVLARSLMGSFREQAPAYNAERLRESQDSWRPAYRVRQERIITALVAAGLPER